MAVTHNYMAYVVNKLEAVGPIKTRRMFSGVGIYRDDTIFAIIANNTLYFKTDARSRTQFEALGMAAFQPVDENPQSHTYHQLPEQVLNDCAVLEGWIDRACEAGLIKDAAKVSLAG